MRWWNRRRQPWYDATYWAVDLETTGLDPRRDRILSVGMVPVRDGVVRWGERLYTLVRARTPASLCANASRPGSESDRGCAQQARSLNLGPRRKGSPDGQSG